MAAVLFIVNRHPDIKSPEEIEKEYVAAAGTLDHQIDTLLQDFGIEKEWVKRTVVSDQVGNFTRIERRVAIPSDILPASMNKEINSLARKFDGRAVATENLKDNSVTIHIVLHEKIIHTVILKTYPDMRRKEQREQSRKV